MSTDTPTGSAAATIGGPATGPTSPAVTSAGSRFAHVRALDGLRGVAVALVVVYHFAPTVLPAGFLGVDVFFVLSGFLITSLALREHRDTGTFGVQAFFGRRIRRLLPAAAATIFAVVVVAAILEPDMLRAGLRGEAIASLGYVANWWSIGQGSSYQASFGPESPLNHFWSLAVEEQFYLLFPLVLAGLVIALRRRRMTANLPVVLLVGAAVAGIASMALMRVLHDPTTDPSRAYLGSDSRAQAILVGVATACVLHLWPQLRQRRGVTTGLSILAALAVVFLGVTAVRSEFRDPWLYEGGFTLVAVATAAIILAVCLSRSSVARVFEWRGLVLLGVVSYGLYLWHWPVRVFVDGDRTGLDGVALFSLRVALTAVATALSFHFIEAPFRRRRANRTLEDPQRAEATRTHRTFLLGGAAIAVVALTAWVVAAPPTAPATTASATAIPVVPEGAGTGGPGTGEAAALLPTPLKVLWEGDSVAWTLGGGRLAVPHPTGYDSPFDPERMVIWNKGTAACPLLNLPARNFGVVRPHEVPCAQWRDNWQASIAEFQPDVVSWSGALLDTYDVQVEGRWIEFGSAEWEALYRAELEDARAIALAAGARFMILGQPDPDADPDQQDQENLLPENIGRFATLRGMQERFAANYPDDTAYVDLDAVICPGDTCPELTPDGEVYRVDGVHYSPETAKHLGAPVADAILAAVAELRSPPWRGVAAPDPTEVLPAPLKILWQGDSVAWTLGGGALQIPLPEGYEPPFDPNQIVIWNKGELGCPLLNLPARSFGVVRLPDDPCDDWRDDWQESVAAFQPDVVSWSGLLFDTYDVELDGRWVEFGSAEWEGLYRAELEAARQIALGAGARFMIVGQPTPEADDDEPFQDSLLSENIGRFAVLRDIQRRFAASHPDDTAFVDLAEVLCPGGTCPELTPEGIEYRPDGIHYMPETARALAVPMADAILAAVAELRSPPLRDRTG